VSQMSWSLIVTKGRTPGASYPLSPGETIVGHADGPGKIDLSDQEAGARRMADSQAAFDCGGGGVAVRDLESPAGTFVNRRRILPGRSQPLADGDLIDLGSVQLRFSQSNGQIRVNPSVSSRREPFRFSGLACESWDDFVTLSAQHWPAMVAEVESGRLPAYLLKNSLPSLPPAGSGAEKLDLWLASLPTTKSTRPELDVHPSSIVCRIEPGATVRRELVVSNIGYRLLRGSVELPDAPWLRLVSGARSESFVIAESLKVFVEISRPDGSAVPYGADLRISSDGGDARVTIRVEGTSASAAIGESQRESGATNPPWFEGLNPATLILIGAGMGLLIRSLLWLGWMLGPDRGLAGPAALGLGLGGLIGLLDGMRRKSPSLMVTGSVAGSVLGAMAASLALALGRVVEAPLGWGGTAPALAAWMGLGAAAGWWASWGRNADGRPL
jgi:hypothetical protein